MECVAVDWSGALRGEASRIWIAQATGGRLTALHAPGSRSAVADFLAAQRLSAKACLVGLDFAFGMPAWFASENGWTSVVDVWTEARTHGEQWLAECTAPFWGRPGVRRSHDVDRGLRETERSWVAVRQPKSVFQIGGAGSVGTGSIRGMPMLLDLRRGGWAVWPFDAPGSHTLVEIYPRAFTGPVVKSRRDARARYLAQMHAHLPPAFRLSMEHSEDAFDAGIAAIGMSQAVATGATWPQVAPIAALEGQIWEPDVIGTSRDGLR